jgi:hypothetical protein
MKKMELFRDGLNGELFGWLNLVKFDNYHMLVNKAISQEDAMKRAQAERKKSLTPCPIMRSFASFTWYRRLHRTSSKSYIPEDGPSSSRIDPNRLLISLIPNDRPRIVLDLHLHL